MPLVSDSATCSPVSRQTLARRNRVSRPSTRWSAHRRTGGVEAMVKLATGRAGRGETQPGAAGEVADYGDAGVACHGPVPLSWFRTGMRGVQLRAAAWLMAAWTSLSRRRPAQWSSSSALFTTTVISGVPTVCHPRAGRGPRTEARQQCSASSRLSSAAKGHARRPSLDSFGVAMR